MRQDTNPRLPADLRGLVLRLSDLWPRLAGQINRLSEGQLSATHNAAAAAPTTGTHAQGDFIRNSAPAELGAPGSKYVVEGWMCVTAGTPGSWVEKRFLTGN